MPKGASELDDFDDNDGFNDVDLDSSTEVDLNDLDDIEIADDKDVEVNLEDDNADAEFDVEIVDDTPEADQGLSDDPDALEADNADDEAMTYSRKVKKRMDKLTKVANTERRAREALERTHNEAVQVIQTMRASQDTTQAELQDAREKLHNGEKVYVTEVLGSLEAKLAIATAAFENAFELGETKNMSAANQEIATLTQRIELAKQYSPPAPPAKPDVPDPATAAAQPQPQPQQQPARAQPLDPTVKAWTDRNEWFNDPDKAPMRSVAMAVHGKLIEKGLNPQLDATKYYATIDREMRKRFPDHHWPDVERKRQSLTTNNAGTRRTKPRTVKLTKSQVTLAKNLGLSPEAYAAEVVKLAQRRS